MIRFAYLVNLFVEKLYKYCLTTHARMEFHEMSLLCHLVSHVRQSVCHPSMNADVVLSLTLLEKEKTNESLRSYSGL